MQTKGVTKGPYPSTNKVRSGQVGWYRFVRDRSKLSDSLQTVRSSAIRCRPLRSSTTRSRPFGRPGFVADRSWTQDSFVDRSQAQRFVRDRYEARQLVRDRYGLSDSFETVRPFVDLTKDLSTLFLAKFKKDN